MRNIALKLMYNGTAYHGWQVQKNAVTVCETLQKAIGKSTGETVHLTGCGRTDAGVHAENYIANFRTESRIPLERLLNGLKRFHVPVHELAMMMSIALRFIPTLIEEPDKIMSAQKARGADFESGNLFQRAKALIPILVPLFISAFRRADELATAMECRCYHGGEGRTKLHVLKYERRDYIALVIGVLVLAAVLVLRYFGI